MSGVRVTVPTPWRDVGVDDLIEDRRGRLWIVTAWQPTINAHGTVTARLLGTQKTFQKSPQGDDLVDVLRPQLEMLRGELGAEVAT